MPGNTNTNTRTDTLPDFLFLNDSLLMDEEIRFTENYSGTRWGWVEIYRDGILDHNTNDSDENDDGEVSYTDINDNEIEYDQLRLVKNFLNKVNTRILEYIEGARPFSGRNNEIYVNDEGIEEEWVICGKKVFFYNEESNKYMLNPNCVLHLIQTNAIEAFENEYELSFNNSRYKKAVIKIVNYCVQNVPDYRIDYGLITNYFGDNTLETNQPEFQTEENPENSEIIIHQRHQRFRNLEIDGGFKECEKCKEIFYSEDDNNCPHCNHLN